MTVAILLFAATFLTTLLAGSFVAGANPFRNPADLTLGFMFSLPLLAILVVHEMGHYVAARRHGVAVTPPYFIPAPPFIGTFGAFIKIRSPFPHRNAMLDIGAAGPIAGAIVAIPTLFVGLSLSALKPSTGLAGTRLGESLMYRAAEYVVFGSVPAGVDVVLHPVAFAGWIGLLVTALNLIPSGQLDGGHIAYAIFGGRYAKVARVVPYILLPMGFLSVGWVIWAVLLFFLGTRHPAPVFAEIPISPRRRVVGLIAGALLILCFTPTPFMV